MRFARSTLEAQISGVSHRLQRLEQNHAELLARIGGEAALRRAVAAATEAAQTGAIIGAAIEDFASAMRRPLKRGRSGRLARAR